MLYQGNTALGCANAGYQHLSRTWRYLQVFREAVQENTVFSSVLRTAAALQPTATTPPSEPSAWKQVWPQQHPSTGTGMPGHDRQPLPRQTDRSPTQPLPSPSPAPPAAMEGRTGGRQFSKATSRVLHRHRCQHPRSAVDGFLCDPQSHDSVSHGSVTTERSNQLK